MIFEVGNGNPLQYSYLENPMDKGAWWATVCHGVAKESDTTKWLITHAQITLKKFWEDKTPKAYFGISLYPPYKQQTKTWNPQITSTTQLSESLITNPHIGVSGHHPSKAARARVSASVKENVERQRGLLRALVAGEAKCCQEVLTEKPSRAGSTQPQNFRWVCRSSSQVSTKGPQKGVVWLCWRIWTYRAPESNQMKPASRMKPALRRHSTCNMIGSTLVSYCRRSKLPQT